MKKAEDGRYDILLRQDYLEPLEIVQSNLDRDSRIQQATELYLALPEGRRYEETQRQDVRISWPEGTDPEHHMMPQCVHLSDDLIEKLEPLNSYTDAGVNAAIRLWLQSRGVEGLIP